MITVAVTVPVTAGPSQAPGDGTVTGTEPERCELASQAGLRAAHDSAHHRTPAGRYPVVPPLTVTEN